MGRSLLLQLCVIEVVSIIFFVRIVASVLGCLIPPVSGGALQFAAVAHGSRVPAAPQILVAGCIAVLLLSATIIAWLYFHSRLSAHAALALYSLFSMAMLLGFK